MVVPAEDRFRVVLETAVRIYMRPICGSTDQAPEVTRALAEMVAEVADGKPIEVVFDCRLPELQVSVSSGSRRASTTFRFQDQD